MRAKRELGRDLLAAGELSQARALAKQIIAAGKANFADHMIVARSYFLENNFQLALEYVEEARQLEPTRPGPILLLARILERRDGPAQKAVFLSDCIAQGIDDVRLTRQLGRAFLATGKFSQARTLAKQVVATGKADFKDYMTIATSFLHENELQQALNFANEAKHLAPTEPEPVLLIAQILQLRDGPAQKVAYLSDCLAQGTDQFEVKRALAISQINLGNFEAAITVARTVDLAGCDGSQLFTLSEIFEMCNCEEEADICLRHIDQMSTMGNTTLLSDFLKGQLDAETTLRLKASRNLQNDKFGRAIEGLCQAEKSGSIGCDHEALKKRLSDIAVDCKGAESYFAINSATELSQKPLVSIIAPIHRADDQDNLLRQLLRQDYPNLEVLILINGLGIDEAAFRESLSQRDNFKRVQIDIFPSSTPLSNVLNAGFSAARGIYIARFDADDLYLERYISRTIQFMLGTSADICGKRQLFRYLEALECVCFQGDRYDPIARINRTAGSGSTLTVSREVIKTIQFKESLLRGEDTDFYYRSWSHGFRIAFAPPFDHIVIRRADKFKHTWKLGDLRFLMGADHGGFLSCCSKGDFETLLNGLKN